MEGLPITNNKILKNRVRLNMSMNKSNSCDNIDMDNEVITENSIIMVKPYTEIPSINSSNNYNSIPDAFGDTSALDNLPKAVITKIYEGSSHSSPKTIRLKKHVRPRSSAEMQHYTKSEDESKGLCCTLSEEAFNPIKVTPLLMNRKDLLQQISSHSLDIKNSHGIPEIKSPLQSSSLDHSDDDIRSESKCASNNNSDISPNNYVSKHRSSCKSVDNLVLKNSIIHSSPESTRSVPTGNVIHRSGSHDTVTCNTISTDSLAKQSLLAAQVLHLIPTTMARERNYLQGKVAVNSLLGAAELERVLPGREVRLFVGTWNMNGQSPPNEMNDFILPNAITHVPDILAIGTQESCSERFEWEVILQETIGPTHVLLHSTFLGTLHLAIFIRRDLIWFCSLPEDTSMSVRTGSAFRTKGAVAISFSLFGTTYLFVTAHLTAHQEKVKERVQDIKRIIRSLDLPKNLPIRHKNKDVTQNFDCVFWCGDLNFRLGEPRDKVLEWINNTTFPLPPQMPHGYMHSDQLTAVLSDGAAFKGFQEAQIRFPPTYKYDPGTQKFDTSSKQRAPAYTDRILFKSKIPNSTMNYLRKNSGVTINNEQPFLECLLYDSVPTLLSSDHKPVWALFKNIIRPGIDTVPLAAGLFNRDVYLEGVKRRAMSLERSHDSSGVCSLQ